MKSKISQTRNMKLVIFLAMLCLSAMPWLSPSRAEAAAATGPVVGAIEGQAEVSGDIGQEIKKLASWERRQSRRRRIHRRENQAATALGYRAHGLSWGILLDIGAAGRCWRPGNRHPDD